MMNERWYHENGKCKKFSYAGCAGSGNNFETEADCVRTCIGTLGDVSDRGRNK